MAGGPQLRTLLWKNFGWSRKHWFATLSFYLFPLLLCGLLVWILYMLPIENQADCDYDSLVLPPSHPAFVLQSLVCTTPTSCATDKTNRYKSPFELFADMQLNSSSGGGDNSSVLCPGLNRTEAKKKIMTAMFYAWKVLYYPRSAGAADVLNRMASRLDQIGRLRSGLMFGNSTEEGRRTLLGLFELAQAALCYQPLADRFHSFDSRQEAIDFARQLNFTTEAVWAIVHFENVDNDFNYAIIPHYDRREVVSTLYLQSLVESAAVERLTNRTLKLQLAEKLLPTRCHKKPMIYAMSFAVFAIVLSLGVVVVCHAVASEICYEKSAGLLEFLFIAGVSRLKIKTAWYIWGVAFTTSVSLLIGLVFKFVSARLMEHSELTLILAFQLCYALALLSLSFCLSSAASSAQKAGIVTIVLLVAAWLPPQWAQILPQVGYDENIMFARVVSLLHPSVAAQIGWAYMIEWEKAEVGAGWANFRLSPIQDDKYGAVAEAMLHMLLQALFYMLLSCYFDFVAPSQYGFKEPFYFPLTPSFWFGARRGGAVQQETGGEEDEEEKEGQEKRSGGSQPKADVEELNEEGKSAGVELLSLTKVYGGTFRAVDRLSVKFYRNEITALLGHNGAGKSTAMNMLTGMIAPSHGTALIGGRDILNDMKTVRRNLGFCPQYDIIYPELTVREHMAFYGRIRGLDDDKVAAYADEMFGQMSMGAALDTPAGALSGGMKRKLSIVISFLVPYSQRLSRLAGNSDECSTKMESLLLRAIWDVVLKYRDKATVVISTHYMQEADILGDRIAIINQGRLRCFGTTMYLKERYGNGFTLKLAHQGEIVCENLADKLRDYIQASLVSSTATETTFVIDVKPGRSPKMIEALRFLENEAADFGISSFGVSESTMENVFFKVAADDDPTMPVGKANSGGGRANSSDPNGGVLASISYQKVPYVYLLFYQLAACWIKRFHLTRRSKIGAFFQIFMPLVFTLLLLFLNNVIATAGRGGNRELMHPWNHSSYKPVFFFDGPTNNSFLQSWLNYGLGTMCMNGGPRIITEQKAMECSDNVQPLPSASEPNEQKNPICECRVCDQSKVTPANEAKLRTSGYLLNLKGRNITRYLLTVDDVDFMFGVSVIKSDGGINLNKLIQSLPEDLKAIFQVAYGAYRMKSTKARKVVVPPTFAAKQAGKQAKGNRSSSSVQPAMLNNNKTRKNPFQALFDYFSMLEHIPNHEETYLLRTGLLGAAGRRRPTRRDKDMRHSSSTFLNAYYNVLLRSLVDARGVAPDYGITYSTEEVSMTEEDLSMSQMFSGIMLGMFSTMALIMPTFAPLMIVTNDRGSGNKQLHNLMGMNAAVYWLANFIWDVLLYCGSLLLVMLFMYFFPDVFQQDMLAYFYICLTFGVGMILSSYVISFVVKQAHTTILVEFVLSPFFAVAALILLNWRKESWYPNTDVALSCFPPYFISISLTLMALADMLPNSEPLYTWEMLGKRFACAAVWCAAMLALLLVLETKVLALLGRQLFSLFGKKTRHDEKPNDVDADVAKEREDVDNGAYKEGKLVLTARNLRKVYGRNAAVKNVSFGVSRQECFGLLGANGAGKSTLFKMLAGFDRPTAGDAWIKGRSVFAYPSRVADYVSYCPQEDVLYEAMTPAEHLHYYGRVRGIAAEERDEFVEALLVDVGLSRHLGKLSSQLSGGNKRKLNFAIALVDFPALIFLDEMTTGLDPKARRSAWNCLQLAMSRGCSAVITSHSMEECEQLCNRLVIMVNGEFRCIGGVQYLKDKFGKNYNVKFRLGQSVDVAELADEFAVKFAGSEVVEQHLGYAELQIPADNIKLSELYELIHAVKERHAVEDFSCSQTTLEHVFVNMVKAQA